MRDCWKCGKEVEKTYKAVNEENMIEFLCRDCYINHLAEQITVIGIDIGDLVEKLNGLKYHDA